MHGIGILAGCFDAGFTPPCTCMVDLPYTKITQFLCPIYLDFCPLTSLKACFSESVKKFIPFFFFLVAMQILLSIV